MKPLTCLEAEPLLAEFVEAAARGRPSESAVKPAELAEHLASCAACREAADNMRLALAWTQSAEEIAVPARLVARILEQTSEQAGTGVLGWRRQLRAWFRPVLEPRFAMGAAMSLISFSLLLNATGADLRQVKLADLSPARLYFSLDRQAHLATSRAVKAYRDLRIVYEIQSQLQAIREQSAAPEEKTDDKKPGEPPPEPARKEQNRNRSRQPVVIAAAIPVNPGCEGGPSE